MCQDFLNNSSFYTFLSQIDQDIATEVQGGGCPYCGGVLHSARYPRKPRGLRHLLDDSYATRLSFCCAEDGCRRRTTPPSVRFLGRKVYLGVIIVLITALEHGLSPQRRKQLIETLDIWPQTMARWKRWWRTVFPDSRCWQTMRGYFIPPVNTHQLPGALLGSGVQATLLSTGSRLALLPVQSRLYSPAGSVAEWLWSSAWTLSSIHCLVGLRTQMWENEPCLHGVGIKSGFPLNTMKKNGGF